MQVTTRFEVTDCRDCSFKHPHRGHGECWEECTHPSLSLSVYEVILWGCGEEFSKVPEWCPLGL